ncbi:MAG: hypothetical protein JJT94_11035 [Bernardetiaceae bacterium]|nr:hypothetical protein [Bernardetiaceae bacterium]
MIQTKKDLVPTIGRVFDRYRGEKKLWRGFKALSEFFFEIPNQANSKILLFPTIGRVFDHYRGEKNFCEVYNYLI